MKKVIFTLLIGSLLFGFASTQAQSKIRLGLGGIVALPMGDFSDWVSLGFGGIAQGEMDLADKFVGTLTTGYMMFPGKEESGISFGDWSNIPVLVGAKYYFTPGIYGMAQLGLNFLSYSTNIPVFNPGTLTFTTRSVDASDTKFGFGIGVGYDIPVGTDAIDLSVKFATLATDANYIGLTALYRFGLN